MSNERSARPSDSMTIGTRGMASPDAIRNRWVACQHSAIVQPMSCVTRELLLEDLDPVEAWDAVVDMETWLAEEAELELEPGATLSWWWWSDEADDLGTRVEVRLVEAISGTRVVVVEEGFAAGPVAFAVTTLLHRAPILA